MRIKLIFILVLAPSVFLCSCATTGYQHAFEARSAVNDARLVTVNVQKRLDTAVQAISNLTTNDVTNLVPPYDRFASAVESFRMEVDNLVRSDQVVQKRNNAYVAKWQELLKGYGNPSVRARSAERREEVIARFQQLKSQFLATEQSLRALLVSFQDLRRYLGTDLTDTGVTSAREQPRISTQATEAQGALQTLLADLTRIADELSSIRSTTPAKAPADGKSPAEQPAETK